ncbi:3-ketodihydrosphingosine reductase [Phlebotomus argentipes]|uniref:3-ketodihydrosphingosine reductase n=1 Tax=Phlebotomus argentipes TaxID=94469 RepID=UPI0028937C67|nr:3-ketodihydrosphingosine reductase [Phlebotomus argentipes]
MALDLISYALIALVVVLHVIVLGFVLKKRPKNISGKHVVVTGGSSGIGLWSAVHCFKRGAHVTIVARNVKVLNEAKKEIEKHRINESQKILVKSLDLATSYEIVERGFKDIEEEMQLPIYMLVNCAGMAICGLMEDISVQDAKFMMDVNYYGTYYPTRYILPKMKAAGEGIIVITSSQAALLGIYGYGPYAATKFALRGLAETIQMEASQAGVGVTLALPCDTDTPGFEREEKTKPDVTKLISSSGGLMKPADVAERLVEDALRGSFFSVYGLESWILSILCVGMAPWTGFYLNMLQLVLMSPLRLVSFFIRMNFNSIIKSNSTKVKKE